MTKAAVAVLARGLAVDFAPRGITVNTIQPGPTETDMVPADGPHADVIKSLVPLKRLGHADEIAAMVASKPPPLGDRERQQLMQLGDDLELAWSHPSATAATRKRILRAALNEIVVRKEGPFINMVLHWQGGDHTALQVKLRLNAAGRRCWLQPEDTKELVRELARLMPDRQIARLLNRSGKPTGYGNGWTEQRVRGFRKHHDIEGYRDGEWAERGEITLDAAAEIIGVAKMTALRMIRTGDLNGRQACKGAPWVIKAEDVAAFGARKCPVTPNLTQQIFEFQ